MTTVISGSSPSITFSDSTTQTTAFTSTPSVTTITTSSDASISGLTVGKGGGSVSTNTAVGNGALAVNTTGNQQTIIGASAGVSITINGYLSAVGYQAAYYMTDSNDAFGRQALYGQSGATGYYNCGFGNRTLYSLTTGNTNAAFGTFALQNNTTGSSNFAGGYQALNGNTTASYNTGVGYQSGYSNVQGSANTFLGYQAGYSFVAGSAASTYNTFLGYSAGYSVTTGTKNTIIGTYTGNQGGLDIRTSSNYIVLSDGDGNPRFYLNNSGYPFFPSIRGSAGTYAARFTGNTELTLDTSSARYKDNIRDSVYGLDDILKMQSRQFEYKDDGRSDVGFVAEEMVDVIPEVVAIDKQGRPDAVSYDRLVSVCVKAIQELKTIVDAQAALISGQATEIAELKAKVG